MQPQSDPVPASEKVPLTSTENEGPQVGRPVPSAPPDGTGIPLPASMANFDKAIGFIPPGGHILASQSDPRPGSQPPPWSQQPPSPPPPYEEFRSVPTSDYDAEGGAKSGQLGFDSISIRQAFVKKVFFILTAQMALVTAVVSIFSISCVLPLKPWITGGYGYGYYVNRTQDGNFRQAPNDSAPRSADSGWSDADVDAVLDNYPVRFCSAFLNAPVFWTSIAVFLLTYIILLVSKTCRRKFPLNMILLGLFTLATAYMISMVSVMFTLVHLFIAFAITLGICASVAIFSMQTKYDFTSCAAWIFMMSMVLILTGIAAIIVGATTPGGWWLNMIFCGLGVAAFAVYLAIDLQLIMGGRREEISPEDYVAAAAIIFVDLLNIFLYILKIIALLTKKNN